MNNLRKELEINCQQEEQKIITFIQKTITELHKKGAVIGLSGGLDSSVCAYLLVKALGKKKVLGLFLLERDSSPVHHQHAHMVADNLGLKTIEVDMTNTLKDIGVYDIGPEKVKNEADYGKKMKRKVERGACIFNYHTSFTDFMGNIYGAETSRLWKVAKKLMPKETRTAFLFTKIRLRMLYFYFFAWQYEYAVIGTTDKSEYTAGVYDKHGDGANDITLLRHLYKTQIKQLAEHMGLPEGIVQKPHTADLYGNLPHETELGISYEQLDMLLYAMSKGYSDKQLAEIVPDKAVKNIKQCIEIAGLIRRLPLSLD